MKNITVAKRYAKALYLEAKAENVVKDISADLDALSKLTENREFGILINNVTLSAEDTRKAIEAIYKKGFISKLAYAFLTVLAGKRRLSILPQVIESVNALVREENNEVLAEVVYAAKVNEDVKSRLAARLKKLTQKSVILKESVDPSLLGGLKVVIRSTLYDASVRGRISAMKALLR